jgi:pyrroloquinoline quinone (PQQ) biosynthesis protein C
MSVVASRSLMDRVGELVKRGRAQDRWTLYSETGLSKRGAALYVQQHGIFTRHSRRVWAYVVGNCPEVEVRRFIVKENLYDEEGIEELSHYLKLVKLGHALGLSDDEISGAQALPTTRAALLIWETLTKDRHWLIGAAAKGALEYRNTPGAEGQRWIERLGLSRDDAEFWLMHHEIDRVHGAGALDLVGKYAVTAGGVGEDELLAAVEDSMTAWNLFRGGIADAALVAGT